MDAEHRHELKTNELAEWIAHFPDFCRRNATTIIGVLLVVAAAVVFLYGRSIRSESRFEQQAEAISLIERYNFDKLGVVSGQENAASGDAMMIAANRLEMAADQVKSPHASALLLIKHGEALRADLHYRSADVDVEIREERIKEARQAYEKALTLAEGNTTLVAMARFGLGLCAEEANDYIQAEEIYSGIAADPDFSATVFPAQARGRLDSMQDNRMQFDFVATAPPEAPAPQPGTAGPVTITPTPTGPVEEVTIGAQDTPQAPPAEVKEDAPAAEKTPATESTGEQDAAAATQPEESPGTDS